MNYREPAWATNPPEENYGPPPPVEYGEKSRTVYPWGWITGEIADDADSETGFAYYSGEMEFEYAPDDYACSPEEACRDILEDWHPALRNVRRRDIEDLQIDHVTFDCATSRQHFSYSFKVGW